MRIAYAIMLRSKEELVELNGELDHESVDQMMADLAGTAEVLKQITAMVETAYVRVLASASKRQMQRKPFVIDGKLQRARAG